MQTTTTTIPVIFDMETQDPDDFITLCFLAGNPKVQLKGVTIVPGSPMQVGIVRWALNKLNHPVIPIGSYDINHQKSLENKKAAVSGWHFKVCDNVVPSPADMEGYELLLQHCDSSTMLITGGPLKNLGAVLKKFPEQFQLGTWIAQGGFAGHGVVPENVKWPSNLNDFKDKQFCPTFNFSGDIESTKLALNCVGKQIKKSYFVSKNVCHLNKYNSFFQSKLYTLLDTIVNPLMKEQLNIENEKFIRLTNSLNLIHSALGLYIQEKGEKKLHDPLAAVAAISPIVCQWEEVNISNSPKNKTQWGSEKCLGTNQFITVDFDQNLFFNEFFSCEYFGITFNQLMDIKLDSTKEQERKQERKHERKEQQQQQQEGEGEGENEGETQPQKRQYKPSR